MGKTQIKNPTAWYRLALVGLLLAAVLLPNLGSWDLRKPDEPRYAQVAREMMDTGRYILPHVNGEVYPDKPPLYFWLVALASRPFGEVTAFSARLPAALAGLGLVLLTWLIGRRLYDEQTALLGALILFTCKEMIYLSTTVHLDSLLAFFTTLALYLFYLALERRPDNNRLSLGGFACLGLAVLVKGPVGLVVPLIVIVAFLASRRDFSAVLALRPGRGLLLAAAVVAVWIVPACLQGGHDYTMETVFHQTAGRAVKSFSHQKPFYYYLTSFPFDIIPWSLFIPGAILYFWRNRRQPLHIRFPLVWFLATFVFFSLVSGKRDLYLIQLYPAAALLLARYFSDHITRDQSGERQMNRREFLIPAWLLFGLLALAGPAAALAALFGRSWIPAFDQLRPALWWAAVAASVFGAAGIAAIRGRARLRTMAILLVAAMVAFTALSTGSLLPASNALKSPKPFCERIMNTVPADGRLVATFNPELMLFHLKRYPIPVITSEGMAYDMLEHPQRYYILLRGSQFERAPEELKARVRVLDSGQIGHHTYLLAVTEPAPTGAPLQMQ